MNTPYNIRKLKINEKTQPKTATHEKEDTTMFKKIFNSLYNINLNRYLRSEYPNEYKEYTEIYRQFK